MRIMLIDHRAGSPQDGGDCRCYYLACGLMDAGHEVVIVTAGFAQQEPRQQRGGVAFHVIDTPAYDAALTERGRSLTEFARKLYFGAVKLAQEYTPQAVVVSTGYPYDFFGAQRLAKKCGAKLVYEMRAIWSVTLREKYREPADGLGVLLADAAAKRAVRDADAVVSALPRGESYLEEHGLTPKRFLYVPDIVLPPEGDDALSARDRDYLARIRKNYTSLILYEGEIGAKRRLALLMQAAALPQLAQTAVILCGNGGYKIALKRLQKELSAANVYLMDRLPPAQRTALSACADCLYFGDSRASCARYGYTGRELYETMCRGGAVLACLDDREDAATRSGCGFNAEAPTPQAVADAAVRLLALPQQQRAEMARRGRDYVLENHSAALAVQRYAELLVGLA